MGHEQKISNTICGYCIIGFLLLALFTFAWKLAAFWGVLSAYAFIVGAYLVDKQRKGGRG